jgi:Zn-dependent protease with chaperone function
MENQTQAQVMSTKDWVITLLISFIPVAGFVMLFVWAFGSGENPNKSNWAKAALIWAAIWCVFFVLFYGTIAAIFFSSGGADNFDI